MQEVQWEKWASIIIRVLGVTNAIVGSSTLRALKQREIRLDYTLLYLDPQRDRQ